MNDEAINAKVKVIIIARLKISSVSGLQNKFER